MLDPMVAADAMAMVTAANSKGVYVSWGMGTGASMTGLGTWTIDCGVGATGCSTETCDSKTGSKIFIGFSLLLYRKDSIKRIIFYAANHAKILEKAQEKSPHRHNNIN
jgi:hypothetical protein